MIDAIWYFFSFVVTLGILVAFHEFGHFWVARRCGVKVLTFSVGFGRAIWKRKGKDGTVYQLGIIPLGGYVRMLDERIDDVSEEERDVSFNAQSVYKRFAIVAAGPVANFILAVAVLWLMFGIGVPTVKPVIGDIKAGSVAAEAQLERGSEILSVDNVEAYDWQQVQLGLMSAIGDDETVLTLRTPDGDEVKRTLNLSDWQFDPETESTFGSLGIEVYQPAVYTELSQVESGSPAEVGGLKEGDTITRIGDESVESWTEIRKIIAQSAGQDVLFTVERNQVEQQISVQIGERESQNGVIGYLGVVPVTEPLPDNYVFNHQYGFFGGLAKGAEKTWELMVVSVKMIGKLLTGDVSVKNLAGPLSIAEGAGVSASNGFVYFLSFLALLSVNLGIINLLPLPVLDGGHLMFYSIEWVRGKPVSERVQDVCYRIGGVLVFALMALAISNDIARFAF
ncbi:sigma E protease regulator RseP [Idiomarina sp. PL1-037]|uniref:sigma E protease regulator RseP n=1 Tax=unclassified Idiomarina TaxID=2614829 RepID=UPI00294B2299|nr:MULTISPECIES: sigma E protease regulator RseP [unclassified Idiomarina]MDV6326665.1 sigma E protease regulator RseP [Idiomarina sp. Sol25]WQC54049.1 sigma E protease regulator RseP [Idiomarina sp. PL1-037]